MRILLVEDEKRMAQALCEILRQEKYEVDHYADGIAGLAAIESGIYDMIMPDVHNGVLFAFVHLQTQHGCFLLYQIFRYLLCRNFLFNHFKADGIQVQVEPFRALAHGACHIDTVLIGKEIRQFHAHSDGSVICIHTVLLQHIGHSRIGAGRVECHIFHSACSNSF